MSQITELQISDRDVLYERLQDKLEVAHFLNRQMVSFQANKSQPIYRWFKYKEGFSASLVNYFLNEYQKKNHGRILDPFVGAGTALFTGQEIGHESYGIELLPVGTFFMEVRDSVNHLVIDDFKKELASLWKNVEKIKKPKVHINHISITKDAFPEETENYLNQYLTYCSKIKDTHINRVIKFAAFSVLENISYTRKDGQYLRWDYRSKRKLGGKPFDKGKILPFKEAVSQKLNDMLFDIENSDLFNNKLTDLPKENFRPIKIIEGSCLDELPNMESDFFDFVITSPPYCNRYDYTRTYALELVFLGYDNEQVKNLRQNMLSCTVENKEKVEYLKSQYEKIGRVSDFENTMSVYRNSKAMTEVNSILEGFKESGVLNNNGIARMVRNYFLEMCFVIHELSRVSKKGAHCIMVNDNVKYGGEEIPVDLILSNFAEGLGFSIEKILVLPKGKGNSSQQMGNFGRTEVRKCVYVWQKQ